jgi:hypothetical protein
MNEMEFESQIRSIAGRMDYPRTPNIAGHVTTRLRSSSRPHFISKAAAWSLTLLLVIISSLLLIPPARAAILEFIQIGVVRILRTEPTPFATPVLPAATTTPQPLIPILEGLMGEMTLQEAQEKVDYQILLPSYPMDLGVPDRVFVQDADGAMTILVWLDPDTYKVKMSLHFLPAGSWAIKKVDPTVIQQTSVNGQYAVWTTGPYPIRYEDGDIQFVRMVNGNVLIWEDGDVTYRLETDLSMDESIRIAESLAPIP